MDASSVRSSATHASLFSRLRTPDDLAAWREFERRYRDLLFRYCRKRGLQYADADDVVQTVMLNLSKTLPQFVYDPQRGRFRDYLYRCARNACIAWSKRRNDDPQALDTSVMRSRVDDSEAAVDPADAAAWHEEWVGHHYRLALERIGREFDAKNLEMFDRNVAGESVEALAASFGISAQAAYASRSRIRARLEALIAEQVRDEDGLDETSSD